MFSDQRPFQRDMKNISVSTRLVHETVKKMKILFMVIDGRNFNHKANWMSSAKHHWPAGDSTWSSWHEPNSFLSRWKTHKISDKKTYETFRVQNSRFLSIYRQLQNCFFVERTFMDIENGNDGRCVISYTKTFSAQIISQLKKVQDFKCFSISSDKKFLND